MPPVAAYGVNIATSIINQNSQLYIPYVRSQYNSVVNDLIDGNTTAIVWSDNGRYHIRNMFRFLRKHR
jgi:hypothetical protein